MFKVFENIAESFWLNHGYLKKTGFSPKILRGDISGFYLFVRDSLACMKLEFKISVPEHAAA